MREFIYYSSTAPTKGNFGNDLMKAGRLDIALHTILGAFFISNHQREDVKLHLVFDGPPDPSKHLEIEPSKNDEIKLSKKDLLWVVRKLLYKYKEGKKFEVFPGYSIEKQNLSETIKQLSKTKKIYILDERGEDIRNLKLDGNEIFVLGDQEGLPKKEVRKLKKERNIELVSIGKRQYLASQVLAIVQNEIDRQTE